jgi:hypothetical protein
MVLEAGISKAIGQGEKLQASCGTLPALQLASSRELPYFALSLANALAVSERTVFRYLP